MCEPTTIALVASMALTAYAGDQQAKAQRAAGNYQAAVAEQNAKLDEFRATRAAEIGSMQEEQQRAKVRQMVGTQRATLAANGIDLGSGTASSLVDETYTMGERDALMTRYNAMNEAWGYRVSAMNERNQGAFAKAQGKAQSRNTYLTTAANVASQAYSGYNSGTFGGKK